MFNSYSPYQLDCQNCGPRQTKLGDIRLVIEPSGNTMVFGVCPLCKLVVVENMRDYSPQLYNRIFPHVKRSYAEVVPKEVWDPKRLESRPLTEKECADFAERLAALPNELVVSAANPKELN